MKAIKFNTGRSYTPQGQEIVAYQVGEPEEDKDFDLFFVTVRFIDLSRMVSGEIKNVTELSQRTVMHFYDLCHYDSIYISDQEKAEAIAAAQPAIY